MLLSLGTAGVADCSSLDRPLSPALDVAISLMSDGLVQLRGK